MFRYVKYNKTLGLNYHGYLKDTPLSDLLRQANINTKNQVMVFYYYSWQYFPYNVRRSGAYNIFIIMGRLTTAHMFQEQFLNQVQKVITMQNVLQEWL